jgi:hypothetical protein
MNAAKDAQGHAIWRNRLQGVTFLAFMILTDFHHHARIA